MDATTLISFLGHSSIHPPFDEFLLAQGIKKRPKKHEATEWIEDKKAGIGLEFSATESFDETAVFPKKSDGRFIFNSATFSGDFSGALPYGISLTQSRVEVDQHLESLPVEENLLPSLRIATYFKNGIVIVARWDKKPVDSFIRFYLPTIYDKKNLGLPI